MRHLRQFLLFLIVEFLTGKTLTVTGCRDWVDFTSKAHLGTIIDTVITEDKTQYQWKEGDTSTNLYEKISLKVSKDVTVPVGSIVEPVDAEATVYGEYQNKLSVKCADVKIIEANTATATPQKGNAQPTAPKTPLRKEM